MSMLLLNSKIFSRHSIDGKGIFELFEKVELLMNIFKVLACY